MVLAGGSAGREFFPYKCAAALAEQMGSEVVEFPGNHAGFIEYAQAFAERLGQVLSH